MIRTGSVAFRWGLQATFEIARHDCKPYSSSDPDGSLGLLWSQVASRQRSTLRRVLPGKGLGDCSWSTLGTVRGVN